MPQHTHSTHSPHAHAHAAGCGHTAIQHGDHVDYLHEGHLHRHVGQDCHECQLEASARNPDQCTPQLGSSLHPSAHQHGPDCGHEPVPHAGHTDYLMNGRLHHPHGGHCDDHGPVSVVA